MKSDQISDVAQRLRPESPQAARCWQILLRGLQADWVATAGELDELIEELERGHDYVVEELGFEIRDDSVRVSLLDDKAECPRQDLIRALKRVRTNVQSGE